MQKAGNAVQTKTPTVPVGRLVIARPTISLWKGRTASVPATSSQSVKFLAIGVGLLLLLDIVHAPLLLTPYPVAGGCIPTLRNNCGAGRSVSVH